MAFIGGRVADYALSFFRWEDMAGEYYANKSKLELTLGPEIWKEATGKTVLDFGCGEGSEAIELAERGIAKRVIGLDINQARLQKGRLSAAQKGLTNIEFADQFDGKADLIYALDSFEHFADPAFILKLLSKLLAPAGKCKVSFGPPWYHPLGAHTQLFPWAHLVFTEGSVMRWRERYKKDGAKRYSDGSGGCNGMTVKRFIALVEQSDLELADLELVPIRKLKWLHNRATREFTTAVIRCSLKHSASV